MATAAFEGNVHLSKLDCQDCIATGSGLCSNLILSGMLQLTSQYFRLTKRNQGTNGAFWSLIAVMAYTRAQVLGETMEEAKNNRGRAERA